MNPTQLQNIAKVYWSGNYQSPAARRSPEGVELGCGPAGYHGTHLAYGNTALSPEPLHYSDVFVERSGTAVWEGDRHRRVSLSHDEQGVPAAVGLTPDGRTAVYQRFDRSQAGRPAVELVQKELPSWKMLIGRFTPGRETVLAKLPNEASAIDVNDSRQVAYADNRAVHVLDTSTGESRSIDLPDPAPDQRIEGLAWLNDGSLLTGTVRLADADKISVNGASQARLVDRKLYLIGPHETQAVEIPKAELRPFVQAVGFLGNCDPFDERPLEEILKNC